MTEGFAQKKNDAWKQNRLLRVALIVFLTYIFFRYLFTLVAPFAFAFLLISLIYPLLQKIQKKIPIKKKYLAVAVTLPILLFIVGILWLFMTFGGSQLYKLPGICSDIGTQMELFFHQCCCRLDGKFGWDGQQMEQYIVEQMTVIMENVQIQIVPQVLASSYNCFKSIFSVIAFLAITGIAVFLMEKEYISIVSWLKKSEDTAIVWNVVEGVISYLVTFIKAQGVILLIIGILCCVVLGVAGIEGGIFWGLLAGFLDMLPFIGTGIVLVPLSVWQLINGSYWRFAACVVLYGACALLREWLEPKLIGKKIGIPPILMLLAVYAGIRLFGVSGIFKGPLSLIVIYEIVRASNGKWKENNAAED